VLYAEDARSETAAFAAEILNRFSNDSVFFSRSDDRLSEHRDATNAKDRSIKSHTELDMGPFWLIQSNPVHGWIQSMSNSEFTALLSTRHFYRRIANERKKWSLQFGQ